MYIRGRLHIINFKITYVKQAKKTYIIGHYQETGSLNGLYK
jgi:hypothetical protein